MFDEIIYFLPKNNSIIFTITNIIKNKLRSLSVTKAVVDAVKQITIGIILGVLRKCLCNSLEKKNTTI